MMCLNSDVVREILSRVDGVTLANAGCACSDFWSVAKEESLWEATCCSRWPSMEEKHVKELISSMGGFRNFYASCFSLIAYDSAQRERDSKRNDLKKLLNESIDQSAVVPSDFLWVVDVHYKNKVIYSKVVWGVPGADDDYQLLFFDSPFRIDLINTEDVDHTAGDELPTIVSVDKPRLGEIFWQQLMKDIRLSWIVINKRTVKAVNLSSWAPLAGQCHRDSYEDFVIRFGSILPAQNILPCKAVQCKLVMKCRFFGSDRTSLKINELSMELVDMMEAYVNGRNGLLLLERALGCKKSTDPNQILESYKTYSREQSNLIEAHMRKEARLDILCILSGIVALASISYFLFKQSGVVNRF